MRFVIVIENIKVALCRQQRLLINIQCIIYAVGRKCNCISIVNESRLQVIIKIFGDLVVGAGAQIEHEYITLPFLNGGEQEGLPVRRVREIKNLFEVEERTLFKLLRCESVKAKEYFSFSFAHHGEQLTAGMPGNQRK